MTDHEKLMLVRHLSAAKRRYEMIAQELRRDSHHAIASQYEMYARDAMHMMLSLTKKPEEGENAAD